MRILMATMQLDIGGAETHIVELSKALARRGVEVYVASNGGAYEKELSDAGIKHFKIPLNSKNPLKMRQAYRGLKKLIEEYKFDVIHGHARIPSFICGKLHKKLHFPFVTTAHWVFNASFPFNLLSNWGQRSLAVSEDIKKYLIDSYNIDGDNIRVTINGIDTEKFSANTDFSDVKKEFNLAENKKRIVYVSRMDVDRSLVAHHLIEAAEDLYNEFPDLEIVIVGGGNDFDTVKAEADAVNKKVGTNLIITTGGRTDINKFTASGDIFVGVSRAALEAMACEKPAIIAGNEGYIGIFNKDKLKVSIDTNFCCRGCEESTPKHLAQDIRTLFKKADLKELGKYSRDIVKAHYSVETMADDALKMYASVLSNKKINEISEFNPDTIEKFTLPYGKNIKNDIIISGYYGFKNSGDDTGLRAMISGLRELCPNIRITVLSQNPSETKRIYGINSINRMNFFAIRKKMRQSTLLISGGGSLIQDVTSEKSLAYYLYIISLAEKLGLKTMLYGNGIGPVLNKDKYFKIAKILNSVDAITLREPDSLQTLKELGVSIKNTKVTADAVFSISEDEILKTVNLREILPLKENQKYFCVSVRSWDNLAPDFEQTLANTCKTLYEKYGLIPVFVPMQPSKDNKISMNIKNKANIPDAVLCNGLSFNQMLSIISESKFVIGMRLHILIYAACAKIPVIGLAYDPKVESMMKYMGQTSSLKVETLKEEELIPLCDNIIKNHEEISAILCKIREVAKLSANENSEIAIKLLKS